MMDRLTALYLAQLWQQRMAAQYAARQQQRIAAQAVTVADTADGVRWTAQERARLAFCRWLVETGRLSEDVCQ